MGVDDYLTQEGAPSRRASPRVLVDAWGTDVVGEERTAGDALDVSDDESDEQDIAAAAAAVPLRSRARSPGLDADDAPLPNAATLRAEALEAELKAWDDFNARTLRAVSARGDRLVALTGTAKDKQKRLARLADEDASARQAAAYRQRLQDAIAFERAEAARLDAVVGGSQPSTSRRVQASDATAPAARDAIDLPGALGERDQRQRLEQLKSSALKTAALAAETAIAATAALSREPALGAAAARQAEREWRARAEAWLNVTRRGVGDASITPGAADRFRQRVDMERGRGRDA